MTSRFWLLGQVGGGLLINRAKVHQFGYNVKVVRDVKGDGIGLFAYGECRDHFAQNPN